MVGLGKILVVAVAALLLAAPAKAGPWPRAKGDALLIFSVDDEGGAVWGEYGLGNGRWISAEARYGFDHAYSGMIAYNRALPDWGRWKAAWHLGVKVAMPALDVDLDWYPIYWPSRREVVIKWRPIITPRLGLSLGRSVERPWPGWASAEIWYEHSARGNSLKADMTLGYRPRPRLMTYVQLQSIYSQRKGTEAYIAPAVTWQLRDRFAVEFGLRQGLTSAHTGAKISTWLEF